MAYLRLEYGRSGTDFQTHVSWLSPHKVRRLTVVGGLQMAVYNDLRDDERVRIFDKGVVTQDVASDDLHDVPLSYRNGSITAPYIRFDEPLRLEDEHFVTSALDHTVPRCDGRAGLAVVESLVAAEMSLRDGGRAVEIDELRSLITTHELDA